MKKSSFNPFNFYARGYFYDPYRWHPGYYPVPFNNYIGSNFANVQQSIYNSGYMTDVIQQSNIMQSAAGICTSEPVPPGEPPVESGSVIPT